MLVGVGVWVCFVLGRHVCGRMDKMERLQNRYRMYKVLLTNLRIKLLVEQQNVNIYWDCPSVVLIFNHNLFIYFFSYSTSKSLPYCPLFFFFL